MSDNKFPCILDESYVRVVDLFSRLIILNEWVYDFLDDVTVFSVWLDGLWKKESESITLL